MSFGVYHFGDTEGEDKYCESLKKDHYAKYVFAKHFIDIENESNYSGLELL